MSTRDEETLLRLARAVAEGAPVDWEREAAAQPALRPQLEKLRALEEIAALNLEAVPDALVGHSTAEKYRGGEGRMFAPGQILDGRYQVDGLLGRGGMGEVWHAFDLKLRVEVALKSLRRDRIESERGLALLHREVRSAREVVSPNVCRIFDLVEIEGHELVSMEYVDGTTLLEMLRERGPLPLREAQDIASQFLAGLEAIHEAGLVHRDAKPENVMITHSGRVVLMDFGLTKSAVEGAVGTVSGTPAYMAPEQILGDGLDARADIFSAGIVLAEMVSGEGIRERASRELLWRGVRQDPPQMPETPWRPVLLKAVAADRDKRYATARALTRALDEVTLRVVGGEDLKPYPGLASFTEADAEYFFGREVEVEQMLRKLLRPHPQALIGPSGAGKSSFLRAGLIPALPEGWRCVVCTPGSSPLLALARAVVPELSGDTRAIQQLLQVEDRAALVSVISGWRRRHDEALLIVDQFEELFTLNPPEVQTRYAELLGLLAVEADVHILLSMRDDFLFHCSAEAALAPIFSELTPLRPLAEAALRRALVQPALQCGYRFEDDTLVEEMLREVAQERGALPLLAFAVAQLWERRDRDTGLLTREAYQAIGGVGGALAQHAEATLARIGPERQSIVREIFRNLVTAQGTRAVRYREELLSVFADREPAETVLREVIDARLLTSFEAEQDEGEESGEHQRVEIIHESLLAAWPRLVRWRAQDAEGALLRDQLHQAARMWDERGRPDDLLWTGTSYREFRVWRERYPGRLTAVEEGFAWAMVSKAERHRKRRRLAIASCFALLLGVLGVVGFSEHRQRVQRQRAEAAKLHALGRVELDRDRSSALAYAIASLEIADAPEVRRFALEALWQGPTALVVSRENSWGADFSPDNDWLALSDHSRIGVWAASGGGPAAKIDQGAYDVRFTPDSDFLVSDFARYPTEGDHTVRVWSIPGFRPVRTIELTPWAHVRFPTAAGRPLVSMTMDADPGIVSLRGYFGDYRFQSWPLRGGQATLLGRLKAQGGLGWTNSVLMWLVDVDASGTRIVYGRDREVYLTSLASSQSVPPKLLARHSRPIRSVAFHPDGHQVASVDEGGEIKLLSVGGEEVRLLGVLKGRSNVASIRFDWLGSQLLSLLMDEGIAQIWDLSAPLGADPIEVGLADWGGQMSNANFHPDGRWIVTLNDTGAAIWPLGDRYPYVLRGHEGPIRSLVFAPDNSWIASGSQDGVRIWPLNATSHQRGRVVFEEREYGNPSIWDLAVDPHGQDLLMVPFIPRILSLEEERVWELTNRAMQGMTGAFGPEGRLVAVGSRDINPDRKGVVIRVWDLESGKMRVLDPRDERGWTINDLEFLPDGRLLSVSGGKLRVWNLETGGHDILYGADVFAVDVSRDGRKLLTVGRQGIVVHDLENNVRYPLDTGGGQVWDAVFDPTGEIVVASHGDGALSVGPVTGGDRHLLLGLDTINEVTVSPDNFIDSLVAEQENVNKIAVSPDGRWIASGGRDGAVRLWPMPEKKPFHTLPYDELLERLKALTNIRVVTDEDDPSGYRIDIAPFPGWETVPTW